MDVMQIPAEEYFSTYLNGKVHEFITTPINYFNLVNQGVMVYDEDGHLLNANMVFRAGISQHHKNYLIWFDDGEKRRYLKRVFNSHEEALNFLESIYQIKK